MNETLIREVIQEVLGKLGGGSSQGPSGTEHAAGSGLITLLRASFLRCFILFQGASRRL